MSGNTGACNFTDIFSGSTPHKIPTIRDTALVFGIIGIIYVLVSLCRLMYYKNKYDHLRKRSILYAAVTSLGVLLQIFGGTLNIGLNYPCWIAVALTMFCFPLLMIPVPLRMLDHFAKYIYAKSLLELQVQKNVELSHSDQSDSWFSAIINVFSFVIKQLIKGGSTNSTSNHGNSSAQIVASSSASVQSISLQGESTQVGKQPKVISMKSIMLLKFLTSSYAQVLVCVLCMFPFVLIIILDFQKHEYLKPSNDCRGCAVSTDQTTVMFACGCVIIALAVIVAIIVRRYPDPFGIMTECRMSMQYGGVIGIIGLLLTNYHPQTDAGKYSFIFIILIGELVIQFVCTDYQIIIAKRVQPKLTRRQRRKQAGRNEAKSTQITETESEDPKGKSLREYIESPESAGFEVSLLICTHLHLFKHDLNKKNCSC